MTNYASIFGTYRINTTTFPAPTNTEWEQQEISSGLNGISINSSYWVHRWIYDELDGETANLLYDSWQEQQNDNGQLDVLETDPHDASLASESYGTYEYTDFVIVSTGMRQRGLPNYRSITILMEVYIS